MGPIGMTGFEFSLNGSIEYTAERSSKLAILEKNQNPYTFSYGAVPMSLYHGR